MPRPALGDTVLPATPSSATRPDKDGSPRPGAGSRTGPQARSPISSGDAARSARVDGAERASVSFEVNGTSGRGDHQPTERPTRGQAGHALVGVGPGVPGPMLLSGRVGMASLSAFPIAGVRIHPPLLRPDTLSRERLNNWLDQAATGRLALIVAEAGFGKTTLLADWARHSSRATAWYRLESDDRDWLTFTRHLVASGRELDPDFAAATGALLMQLGPGGPTREDIRATLATEFAAFGASHPQGLTLIFDDYHVVDASPEVVPTVRALLDVTCPGFSIVIASRSVPKLPLSRLRARGSISRLTGDALCFEASEADRLFRDAYHLPLERDVIDELVERTDGWAALLSLVRANLDGRPDESGRALVRDISGAGGDIYDYLADEVLDHLDQTLRDFLVRVSLLDDLDPPGAAMAVGIREQEAAELLVGAERLSLTLRHGNETNYRFAPLVRDFLRAKLSTALTDEEIRLLHRRFAEQSEGRDWRRAATHYRRAGDSDAARRVVSSALDEILATGQYLAADDLLADGLGDEVVRKVLRSRTLLQLGAIAEAIPLSEEAVAAARSGANGHLALAAQNAASIAVATRRIADAMDYAKLAAIDTSGTLEPYAALLAAAGDGNLPAIVRQFEVLASAQAERGQSHYVAVTGLNLAQMLVWLDRPSEAMRLADEAERRFIESGHEYEAVSARLVQAQARAFGGDWDAAYKLLRAALDIHHPEAEKEAVLEAAEISSWFGPYDLAPQLLQRIDRRTIAAAWAPAWQLLDLWLAGPGSEAADIADGLSGDPRLFGVTGATFRWHLTLARSYLSVRRPARYAEALARAEEVAALQGSPIQRRLSALLRSIGEGPQAVSKLVSAWEEASDALLGVFAPELASDLGSYSDAAFSAIQRAAERSPHRWLPPLRLTLDGEDRASTARAASLIETIGDGSDIARLRAHSKAGGRNGRSWGDALVRRLAPTVTVEDLGPTSIWVGSQHIEGRYTRRKVLALLMFLVSQPNGSATPDQVLDGLWPELKTDQGINSVHQTVYFLRRVIDPDYRAGVSAEYVHFTSDVIWLDKTLVDCRSWECRRILSQRAESQQAVESLLAAYRGRFAPEFAYEDWAAAYRDGLHAAFLSAVERAVSGELGNVDKRWRLWVGQQALAIDPEADAIEALTIRLYRELGATSAALEQYGHYASVMRDELGIEPPTIEEI
jgi:DNA-binding SARP family transcriptional activator